jgi:2-hydroxychromene-2-carboxylate isomerase
MTRSRLEFWFDFASSYSYPAAIRIEGAASKVGLDLVWRPFLLGPLFASQQGLKDSPFNLFSAKGAYMWRDMARLCAGYGLEFTKPSVFPRTSLKAARIAVASAGQPWMVGFVKAVYRANFVQDLDIADPEVLARCVREAGGDPAAALAATETSDVKQALRAATEEAARKGLFGAPSFVTEDGELFWGNDRMEQALAWAGRSAQKTVKQTPTPS